MKKVIIVTILVFLATPAFTDKEVNCLTVNGISEGECSRFISLWYAYHTERLGVSKSTFDQLITIEDISTIGNSEMPRIDYYVNYGEISIKTFDQYPLRLSSDVTTYPAIHVPRDNTVLLSEHIALIGNAGAWNSNLTDFPLGPLAYSSGEELNGDVQNIYLGSGVDKIIFELKFNRSGDPIALLNGSDEFRENCYLGEHSLITKKGEIHRWGPCKVH